MKNWFTKKVRHIDFSAKNSQIRVGKLTSIFKTSMHFSRMHTTCLLPVSPSMHCAGGMSATGGYLLPGGVCYQWEGASATRVGVCYQGELCYWGVSATRGCLLLRGVHPSMH